MDFAWEFCLPTGHFQVLLKTHSYRKDLPKA
jgi:hypothetical protein